jgi:ATP-dependent DNA helicase RecG
MSGRPEILYPLFRSLTSLSGVGPKIKMNLEKIGIESPRDLMFLLPQTVIERHLQDTVQNGPFPSVMTIKVTLGEHRPNAIKGRPYRIEVHDSKTSFNLVFFHPRSDWLREQFPTGQVRVVSGKVELFDSIAQMVHPDFITREGQSDTIPKVEPVYPLTAGITNKTVSKAQADLLSAVPNLPEWVSTAVSSSKNWPLWEEAIRSAHNPEGLQDVLEGAPSRERLAYDELLAHQLTLAIARKAYRKASGVITKGTQEKQSKVLAALPFDLTGAQTRSIDEILQDMAQPYRMNRLLQGDVGAGKTLVALMALLSAVEAGGQGVLMAPTSILAQQHYEGLLPLAEKAEVVIEVLTSKDKGSERTNKLNALKQGNIQILIGTHSVFQKDVEFSNLRLAVIDEQHRFGVRQRMELGAKGDKVDVLVMTATPIPRSLALANYGDMDISILDEKPKGRKPIETVMVSNTRLDQVTERIKLATENGKQAYWVCPLVSESEVIDLAAAEHRFNTVKSALGAKNVGLIHGRLKPDEKKQAMLDFATGKTKVLVATTVIEVGVDVPNASIMVIEQAERYGMSQLHQLRGRVGRGSEKSTCILMYAPPLGKTARQRLEGIRGTNDGFEISEIDLKLRGAGDVLGVQQSGLPKFKIADVEVHSDLMKLAHDEARLIMSTDPELKTEQGKALRVLLYLMGADHFIKLLSVG